MSVSLQHQRALFFFVELSSAFATKIAVHAAHETAAIFELSGLGYVLFPAMQTRPQIPPAHEASQRNRRSPRQGDSGT